MQKLFETLYRHRFHLSFLTATWGVFFLLLVPRLIEVTPEGVYMGHENMWSDWALHIGLANIFATKDPSQWLAYHPIFAGGKFTYPFLADLISGLLMRIGMPLVPAFVIPTVVLFAALLSGMYAFFYTVFRSRSTAVTAIFLFFLSAGFGFTRFLKDFQTNPSWATILYPPELYSRFDQYQWYSGNFIVGMFLPQHAFLLGLPLALWSLTILFRSRSPKWLILAGLFGGILPIAHAHSFIATSLIAGLFGALHIKNWRTIAYYFIPYGLLGITMYALFIHGGIQESFMTWHPGWTAPAGFSSWITQWYLQWGIVLPLALIAWITLHNSLSREARIVISASFALFTLGNLILFQPIPWDNSKIFLWTYLGLSGVIANFLVVLWRRHFAVQPVVVFLFILLTVTGSLEILRLSQVQKNRYMLTSSEDIAFAETIRNNTHPLAIFLTAPDHNHPVMVWAARPVVMGYTAWAWNFGFDYQERYAKMVTMYAGGMEGDRNMKELGVSYVYIGPSERYTFSVNEAYFAAQFPLAFSDGLTHVYDVRSLTGTQ